MMHLKPYAPRYKKPCFRGYRPGSKLTRLYCHRRWLDAKKIGFREITFCQSKAADQLRGNYVAYVRLSRLQKKKLDEEAHKTIGDSMYSTIDAIIQ